MNESENIGIRVFCVDHNDAGMLDFNEKNAAFSAKISTSGE